MALKYSELRNTMVGRLLDKSADMSFTRKRERELIAAAQAGNEDAHNTLLVRHSTFVMQVAGGFLSPGATLEELWAAGMDGLSEAIMRYDLESKCVLISYAVWWIRQRMMIESWNYVAPVTIPVNKRPLFRSVRSDVRDREHRAGGIFHDGKTEAEAAFGILQASRTTLDLDADSRGADGSAGAIHDYVPAPFNDDVADASVARWLEAMIETLLTPRERRVLRGRFWEDMSLDALGQELGFTRESIRQTQLIALKKLRAAIEKHDAAAGITIDDRLAMMEMADAVEV